MNAQEIINFIHDAEKKTPVKVYFKSEKDILFPNCHQFAGCCLRRLERYRTSIDCP